MISVNMLYNLLTSQYTLVFFSSFIGATLGELRRELDDGIIQSPIKFIIELLSSTIVGVAIAIIASNILHIKNDALVVSLSAVFGFIGHIKAIAYLPGINQKK